MSLPVSQYEDLLAEVRGLRRKAQRVQQLARPLLQGESSTFGAYRVTNTDHLQVSNNYIVRLNTLRKKYIYFFT